MNGDFMPVGGHRKKPIDPKRIEEIKRGWKKADEIRKKASENHKKNDIPEAEAQLLKDLENLN